MTESNKAILTSNWLKTKLIKQEPGIIFNDNCFCCFETIQNFIARVDHSHLTPVIYYEAFPEESAAQFLSTLNAELTSKLGYPEFNYTQSLYKIVELAALKMVIIDQSYLHPLNTLEKISNFLASCNVSLILVGSREKLEIAQILNHPVISQWEQFKSYDQSKTLPKLCQHNLNLG